MSWYCVIIVDGEPRNARAAAFVAALRRAWRHAGEPDGAAAFINRGSASRFTFLLSPEAATLASGLLRRYDALACQQAPNLARYAPLPLWSVSRMPPRDASARSPSASTDSANGSRL